MTILGRGRRGCGFDSSLGKLRVKYFNFFAQYHTDFLRNEAKRGGLQHKTQCLGIVGGKWGTEVF